MRNAKLMLCAMALTIASTSAWAVSQGTVTFDGKLIADTCEIDGDANIKVTLPTLAVQTLDQSGKTAGSKGFDLKVTKCPAALSKVAAHFEAIGSSGVNSATGNLINRATEATAAKNVEVRLYNSNEQQLKLGETGEFFDITAQKATMRYYGGYYATGMSQAGQVHAMAQYTLAYP